VAHPDLGQARRDVGTLGGGQRTHPTVDLEEVRDGIRDLVALGVLEVDAQPVGGLEVAHVVGRGDERLARHAVSEHGGPADAVALDDRDVGPELSRDQGSFVPAGTSTEDDDLARPCVHGTHPTTARGLRPQ
jgi:hypothetical protein